MLTIMRVINKDNFRPSVVYNSVNDGFMIIRPHAHRVVDKS